MLFPCKNSLISVSLHAPYKLVAIVQLTRQDHTLTFACESIIRTNCRISALLPCPCSIPGPAELSPVGLNTFRVFCRQIWKPHQSGWPQMKMAQWQGRFVMLEQHLVADVVHVWCGLHQLVRTSRDVFELEFDKKFLCLLTKSDGYLRRQKSPPWHQKWMLKVSAPYDGYRWENILQAWFLIKSQWRYTWRVRKCLGLETIVSGCLLPKCMHSGMSTRCIYRATKPHDIVIKVARGTQSPALHKQHHAADAKSTLQRSRTNRSELSFHSR